MIERRRRIALGVAAVLIAAAGGLAVHGRVALRDGRRLLDERQPELAVRRFEAAAWSPLAKREARIGAELARVLAGETTAVPTDTAGFDLAPLARQAFDAGRWPAAVALAAAAQPPATAVQAAAELEQGHVDAARQLATGDDLLDKQVREALAWRDAGARTVIRDGDGRALGWLGADGAFHATVPDLDNLLPVAALSRAAGDSTAVRLTIDLELSRLALTALGEHRGSIVLLDATTGAIFAAVSDSRTLAAEGGTPAFEQRREPASISKLVTAVAAYRAGIDADAEISHMTCAGHAKYDGKELWCSFPAGPLRGLGHALAVSCNLAFANLGVRLGAPALIAELRRFGYDRPAGLVPWGRILRPDQAALADLSIGLEETEITPAHAAAYGAVFADGRLPDPYLVAADDGALGRTPRPRAYKAPEPIVDAATLKAVQHAMEAVTEEGGTAEDLDPTFPVAMKTGTGATTGVGYHVNYVGSGPLPRPRVAFAVRITHEGSSPRVNAVAREVTSVLFEGLGRRFPPGATEVR